MASKIALLGFGLHCAGAIASAVSINILSSATLAGLSPPLQGSELASAIGNLVLADETLALLVAIIAGSVIDRRGVRLVATASHIVLALAFTATALARTFPAVLLARLLFSLGLCSSITALSAGIAVLSPAAQPVDESEHEAEHSIETAPLLPKPVAPLPSSQATRKTSSLLAGLAGLSTGAGALFGVLVVGRLPISLGLKTTYLLVAATEFVVAIVVLLTMSVPRPAATSSAGRLEHLLRGLHLLRRDAETRLVCASSFASRSQNAVVIAFIPLLVLRYYLEHDLCDLPGSDVPPDRVKSECHAAYALSSSIVGVVQTLNIVGVPLFAAMAHRRPLLRSRILSFAYGLACLGCGILAILPHGDPRSLALVIPAAASLGLATAGGVTIGLAMVADIRNRLVAEDKEIAGALAGVSILAGGLGLIIVGKSSGVLAAHAGSLAPFALQFAVSACALVFCLTYSAKDGHEAPPIGANQ